MRTRDELLATIEADRAAWHALLAEVGTARMEEPGPMGPWTFKDLAAHLLGWRERTIALIEAGPAGEVAPPWPAHLDDDDSINNWIYAQHRDRPLAAVLADVDDSYERLASTLAALPADDLTTPGRFPWLPDKALVDGDFAGHLREEHEPAIRAWLDEDGEGR